MTNETKTTEKKMSIFTAIRIYFSPLNYSDDTVRAAIARCKEWTDANPGRKLVEAVYD